MVYLPESSLKETTLSDPPPQLYGDGTAGGHSVNLWVVVCHCDTEILSLHQAMISLIL